MMTVLLVDDEPLARERLRRMVAAMPDYTVCAEAADGATALEQARAAAPDIVLLDIHMPGVDGLQVAADLAALAVPPAIIFTTAYSEHALTAHSVGAAGYLLKPVKQQTLAAALKRAHRPSRAQLLTLLEERDDVAQRFVVARTHEGETRVALEDIVYCRAEDKYTAVRHLQGELLISDSLNALEQRFGDAFVRIHRQLLVATRFVTGLYTDDYGNRKLRLQHCDTPLPVSRRRLAAVRKILNGKS